jgi:hypothetical protein
VRKYDGAALFDLGLDDRRRSAIDLRQEAHAAINLIDGLPLTAKHGSAKSSGATRLSQRLVASLLDFETAMTIYTAIGVLIVLAILAVVMLYLRGKF